MHIVLVGPDDELQCCTDSVLPLNSGTRQLLRVVIGTGTKQIKRTGNESKKKGMCAVGYLDYHKHRKAAAAS
jgi:hypothetical protein